MIKLLPVMASIGLLTATACSPQVRTVAGPTVTSTATATATVTAVATVTTRVTATPVRTVTHVVHRTRVRTVTETAKPSHGPITDGYTYVITASSGQATDVTYTERGSIEQATGVALPWSKTVRYAGILAEVSAQNAGSGTITCKIYGPSGRLLSRHQSTGAYATVSCQH